MSTIEPTLPPEVMESLTNRGIAKSDNCDFKGAIADFDEAIRLNPKFARVYNNRGIVKIAKGDLDGAIADWDESLRLGEEERKSERRMS